MVSCCCWEQKENGPGMDTTRLVAADGNDHSLPTRVIPKGAINPTLDPGNAAKEKEQLALFLGILTDFFWSRGMDDVIPPPRG